MASGHRAISAGAVVGTAIALAVLAFIGGMVLELAIFGNTADPNQVAALVVMPFVAGFLALAFALFGLFGLRNRQLQSIKLAQKAVAQSAAAATEREAKAQAVRNARQRLDTLVQQSVAALEALPQLSTTARLRVDEARGHFDARAFSPFWSSVEAGYVAAGQYRILIDQLVGVATAYPATLREYVTLGGADAAPTFPVTSSAAEYFDAIQPTLGELDRVTYHAQTDPVFAGIWEQRRTTAAVVAGFANLEAAIGLLSTQIAASVRSASEAVERSNVTVQNTLATSAALQSAMQQAQSDSLVELSRRAEQATWYLKQEHNRATGWS
jgi:hypothetical protein